MELPINKILNGDALMHLKEIAQNCLKLYLEHKNLKEYIK